MAKNSSTSKKVKLPNDFERMIPEYHKDSIIYGEHIVRYLAAQELVKGKTVLDIASGSGYGTASLAQTATKVYGVDVLQDAVSYAQQNYGAENIEYLVGDGVKIPLEDNAVDVVVSFETIEHIEDYRTFMSEVKRVMKPEGLLVLSTPNDIEFAEGNHFHVHEFEHRELQTLVKEYFSDATEYFQADWLYSGIHSHAELTTEWDLQQTVMNKSKLKIDQALYFFMLCANRKVTESITSFGALSEHYSAKKQQEKENLTADHVRNIQAIAVDAKQQYVAMAAERDKLQAEIQAIHSSRTWKLAEKLARAKRKLVP